MRLHRLLLTVALVVSVNTVARAEFIDGNVLHDECEKDSRFCTAYVMAIAETLLREAGIALPQFRICMPLNTNSKQIRDVVKQVLVSNPAGRTAPANYIVANALQQAWPCASE